MRNDTALESFLPRRLTRGKGGGLRHLSAGGAERVGRHGGSWQGVLAAQMGEEG